MGNYSCMDPKTGKYEDIVYRHKGRPQGNTLVYLGDRLIGEIFGPSERLLDWVAVSHADKDDLKGLRMVQGFRTRRAATEYLIDVGVRPLDSPFSV